MAVNQTYTEADIQRSAIFGYDPLVGLFRALQVNAAGELVTTVGTGGGGAAADVRIKDATLAQFAVVDASGRLTVNVNGTVPVSGPLTDAQLRATAVPVSGTFFQATQPVSLAAAVDVSDRAARDVGKVRVFDGTNQLVIDASGRPTVNINGTVTVTGPLTDTQLRASAVPVSGPLTDVQLRAAAVPVSGTFFQATQPVSIAAAVDVSDRAARLLGVLSAGTNRIGSVRVVDSADADLTTTKFANPAGRYLAVALGKDLTREQKTFEFAFNATATAETLMTFTVSKPGTIGGGVTSYTVTAGKRLRIQAITLHWQQTGSAPTAKLITFKVKGDAAAGALTAADATILRWDGVPPPNAGPQPLQIAPVTIPIPDGLEFGPGELIGFSLGLSAFVAGTDGGALRGTVIGYEY